MKRDSRRLLALFFLMLFISSCTKELPSAQKTLHMNFRGDGINTPFYASQFFKLQYIQLKGDDVVGGVGKMAFCDNRYYLAERNKIRVYDEDGNHLFTIDNWGRAKGEYISLHSFDVNPVSGEISIFDQNGSKMLIYNREGQFTRDFAINDSLDVVRAFCVMEKGNYIFYNPGRTPGFPQIRAGAWMVDSVGCFMRHLVEVEEDFYYGALAPYSFYFSHLGDGSISLMGTEDKNLIYHIAQDGKVTPCYNISFDLNISKEMRRKSYFTKEELQNENHYIKMGHLETDNLYVLMAYNPQKTGILFYDKVKDKEYMATNNTTTDFVDDIGFSSYLGCAPDRFLNLYYPGTDEKTDAALGVTMNDSPFIVVGFTDQLQQMKDM